MASAWQSAADALVRDLQRIFGVRLRSVCAYGPCLDGIDGEPVTCLALVASLEMADLDQCAARSTFWSKQRIATPLLLAEREFTRSLDAFPLEYGEIIRAHQRLYGTDPFAGVTISHEDLRRACEAQVKGHLVHLREGFIEAGGRPQDVAELVAGSAPAFAALLRNVARLNGAQSTDRSQATRDGAAAAGLSSSVVDDILALERTPRVPTADAARLFPEYLATVEQLALRVDQWKS